MTIQKFHLGLYVLLEKENRVLLVKKKRGPYTGMWDLPGGKQEYGESPLETLSREIEEETGLLIISPMLCRFISFPIVYQEGNQAINLHHACVIYRAENYVPLEKPNLLSNEDVSESKWFDKESLSQIPLSFAVQEAIREPF